MKALWKNTKNGQLVIGEIQFQAFDGVVWPVFVLSGIAMDPLDWDFWSHV